MRYKTPLRYTILRSNIYYLQFRFPNGKYFKRSLSTDSRREASMLMASLTPLIPFVQQGALPLENLISRIDMIKLSIDGNINSILNFAPQKPAMINNLKPDTSKLSMTLGKAWSLYKQEKGTHWSRAIKLANDRYMEVLILVLGAGKDVCTITRQDVKRVMEVVENLPKRVIQPYRSMTIQELIALDDVPESDLVGVEAIHKHLKIYKSLFKTFLTDDKAVLTKPPTEGITAAPSTGRYGAYSNAEMKKLVGWALTQPDGWQKWITLLLSYTGCRRAEIATLRKQQIKFDEDSQRYYLLIAEGGHGKTDNATRKVVVHQHVIDAGFFDYVLQCEDLLFSEVAGSNMAKVGKEFAEIREQLGIPYIDDQGQRRLLHSIRHSVASTATAGWVKNVAHLQQILGHQLSGIGITKRYLHTFPVASVSYVIDGLNWL